MENTAHTPLLERTLLIPSKVEMMGQVNEVRRAPLTPPTPLPDWLTAYTPDEQKAMENGTLVKYPRTKVHIELEEQIFDIFFERFLEGLVEGELGIDIVRRDPRNISYGRFMRWIKKDSKRVERYDEAKEIQTAFFEDKKHKIAEGMDDRLQDIARAKLQIEVMSDSMKAWNKKRYGAEKESPQAFGAGGIIINIGAVESPYLTGNVIESTPIVEKLSNG